MRNFFELAKAALYILVNEGWRSLWYKGNRWIGQVNQSTRNNLSQEDQYRIWILENEPKKKEIAQQKRISASFKIRPKISIIMPVWNTNRKWLKAAIDSVLNQTYDNWELCIADGGSAHRYIKEILTGYMKKDARIKVTFVSQNKGISGNSNEALNLATGDFIALLDHDDMLAPFGLYEVTKLLNEKPEADLIYSDEDKITDGLGSRFAPLFKPDWSPELLISCNYLTHFTVIRKKIIDEIGGFKTEMDGAQDWDLFLKVTEKTNNIYHIPKILYRWRASDKSCSMNIYNKSYALSAQIKALQASLRRRKVPATVSSLSGVIKINWNISKDTKVSIVIPTKDNVLLLRNCVSSLLYKNTYHNIEIIIIDTGSSESETFEYYNELSTNEKIKVINYHKDIFNYSAANNFGVKHATGDVLLFLNNDTEIIEPDSLKEMLGWVKQSAIGVVGAKLLKLDDSIQHAGVIVGLGGFAGEMFYGAREGDWSIFGSVEWYRNYLAVTAACMMIRREVFDEIKGFNKGLVLCGNDVELCLRVRKSGYRVVYTPFAKFLHITAASRGEYIPSGDFYLSYEHYKPFLQSEDPYFNPNLSYGVSIPCFRRIGEESPLRIAEKHLMSLNREDESVKIAQGAEPSSKLMAFRSYEAANLVKNFDFTNKELDSSKKTMGQYQGYIDIKSINWFIPGFTNPYWGGIRTILQFADYFKENKGVSNRFVVQANVPKQKISDLISKAFPALADQDVQILYYNRLIDHINSADASVATLWTTAYPLLKFNKTKRKFYFIQDYEPSFYAAGSTYGLAEETYRFGFYGICNTISLRNSYENYYMGKAEYFTPCVDTKVFHPSKIKEEKKKFTVFFYGRPEHPRNAFELGIEASKKLKNKMGNNVRIITAGADWKPRDFGLEKIVENLGLLSYEETAELYRQCDVGLVMMFTRHPSYIPFELMASGCLVVSNFNESTTWFLKGKANCILAHASASAISESIEQILKNTEERNRIASNALDVIKNNYINWEKEMDKIFDYMCNLES